MAKWNTDNVAEGEPVKQEIEVGTLMQMYEMLEEAVLPRVKFTDDIEEMRKEASDIANENTRIVRDELKRMLNL